MVLLYSTRLSRRSVTRPGSTGAVHAELARAPSSQARNAFFSSIDGCGFFLGGISPWLSRSRTASHEGRSSWIELASALASAKSPAGFWPPWQLAQYLPMNGLAACSNDLAGAILAG